jgi:hypothetical protein
MGISLEGFALFSLVSRFLTVMVIISGCIQVSMGLLYMFSNYLLVTMYLPEPWSWVINLVVGLFFWYWHQHSWLWGGNYAKMYASWLLVIPWVCISIGIVINWFGFGEKSEGYAFVHSWYWLLSSEKSLFLYIVALPYPLLNCHTITKVESYKSLWFHRACFKGFLPIVDRFNLQSLHALVTKRTLDYFLCSLLQSLILITPTIRTLVGYMVDCHRSVEWL